MHPYLVMGVPCDPQTPNPSLMPPGLPQSSSGPPTLPQSSWDPFCAPQMPIRDSQTFLRDHCAPTFPLWRPQGPPNPPQMLPKALQDPQTLTIAPCGHINVPQGFWCPHLSSLEPSMGPQVTLKPSRTPKCSPPVPCGPIYSPHGLSDLRWSLCPHLSSPGTPKPSPDAPKALQDPQIPLWPRLCPPHAPKDPSVPTFPLWSHLRPPKPSTDASWGLLKPSRTPSPSPDPPGAHLFPPRHSQTSPQGSV